MGIFYPELEACWRYEEMRGSSPENSRMGNDETKRLTVPLHHLLLKHNLWNKDDVTALCKDPAPLAAPQSNSSLAELGQDS